MIKNVRILQTDILSDNWYTLKKVTFQYQQADGSTHTQVREAYDRGNGAAILLYNNSTKSVILTRQFRLPSFINGNPDGFLVEACAGLLDKEDPESGIRRETEEETGYKIDKLTRVFDAYMSPGSVTEILYFFVAEYAQAMKTGAGGGLEQEQENIEVLEMPFSKAYGMIATGEIRDAKTIMLLQYAKINQLAG